MYHEFRVSLERALTNQFGSLVPFHEVRHLDAARRLEASLGPIADDTMVRALQTTLPMGDLNATCFAEVAHMNLLREHGACDLANLASYRQAPPRGELWEVLMVDDHIVTQDVPRRSSANTRREDDEILERSDVAYAAGRLKPKESKRFRKKTKFKAIGAQVDGVRGWGSSKLELILLGIAMSTGIARSRQATGSALTSAVSLWGHALLFNRAAWCFFDDVYHVAGRLGTSQEWATVDRTAVDELLTVALLSPLLGTNIRAPVRSELVCTDARGGVFTGVGAVRAEVRPEVARELYRHRTRRGGYVRAETPQEVRARERIDWSEKLLELRPDLVDDDDHSDDDADDEPSDPRWFGEVCKCIQWLRTFQYRSKGEPINRGELRAVRTAVRRLLRSGHFGVRQIIGIDSKVVEGIIAKGRSSSRELNLLMRSLAADMLVGDIQLGILGLASKHNPADEPSREKRVRKANPAAAPAWARNFVAGDVIALDTVLPADPRVQWCCTPQVRCARS